MSHKDRCQAWVEERKWKNDDGSWQIYDPVDGLLEDHVFSTEEEIDNVLWGRALKVDAPTLYGIDV